MVLLSAGVLVTGRRGDLSSGRVQLLCARSGSVTRWESGAAAVTAAPGQDRTAGYEGGGRRETDSMMVARAGEAGKQAGS